MAAAGIVGGTAETTLEPHLRTINKTKRVKILYLNFIKFI